MVDFLIANGFLFLGWFGNGYLDGRGADTFDSCVVKGCDTEAIVPWPDVRLDVNKVQDGGRVETMGKNVGAGTCPVDVVASDQGNARVPGEVDFLGEARQGQKDKGED